MTIKSDEEGLCWSLCLHDSTLCSENVIPILQRRRLSPREAVNGPHKSQQYMVSSELKPSFHWLKPCTFKLLQDD